MRRRLEIGLGTLCWLVAACGGDDSQTDAQSAAGRMSAAAGVGGMRAQAGSGGRASAAGRAAATAGAGGAARSVAGGQARVTPPQAGVDAADDADAGVLVAPTVRKTPADPNISFDWPEASGGRPVHCEPGHYVGTFTCKLSTQELGTATIEGPVELTLMQSQNGELLQISDAHISGYALLVLNFEATLAGQLECTTRKLTAMAVNGSVGLGSAQLLPVLGFSGALGGELNDAGDTLSGTWSFPVTLADGSSLGTCVGPWTAMRSMP